MSTMPTRALPNELIEAILLKLPALPDSKESVRTLCRFGEANSHFLAVSRSPHIWHSHYIAQWKRYHPGREEARKASAQGDWCQMYAVRSQADKAALDLLDSIVVTHRERRDIAANELASFGYDVWEAVSHQATKACYMPVPDKNAQHGSINIPTRGLTLQYWAREVLGIISRIRAIRVLKETSIGHGENACFEQGLASLSAFFGSDLDTIFEELDRLAESCRRYLGNMGLSNSANITDVIIAICAWMRQEGFVKPDLFNFHNLLNHFPHSVLFGHPRTLPISLVYVFVCIARRLNIRAHPVAFPHRVLAVVSPPVDQPGGDIYVDVFESATRPILSYSEDLPAMLLNMGLDPVTLPWQAARASSGTMVLRAASNIIQSLDRPIAWQEGDQAAAHYAAYCAALILTGDQRLVPALFVDGIGGPLDHAVVFRGILKKSVPEIAQQELNLHLASVSMEDVDRFTPRIAPRDNIRYFTGMVFRHKKYDYIGLVKGWDYRCEAESEWIRRMKVSDLPRGVDQPFYQSFTPDGRTRYVAEDNIEPILRPAASDIHALLEGNRGLGRWFDGVEVHVGRFILSPESRVLYPLDDEFGCAFIAARRAAE